MKSNLDIKKKKLNILFYILIIITLLLISFFLIENKEQNKDEILKLKYELSKEKSSNELLIKNKVDIKNDAKLFILDNKKEKRYVDISKIKLDMSREEIISNFKIKKEEFQSNFEGNNGGKKIKIDHLLLEKDGIRYAFVLQYELDNELYKLRTIESHYKLENIDKEKVLKRLFNEYGEYRFISNENRENSMWRTINWEVEGGSTLFVNINLDGEELIVIHKK